LAALAMQLLRAESRHVDLFALLSPIVAFSLPALALTAALAVLFETIPGLRGGVGNVVYFFVWIALLMFGTSTLIANRPITTGDYFRDYNGISSITGQMQVIVRGMDPQYKGGSSLGAGTAAHATKTFLFTGLEWNQAMVLSRMMWLMIAGAVALVPGSHRDARRQRRRRDIGGRALHRARPQRPSRMGLHHHQQRHPGSLHREAGRNRQLPHAHGRRKIRGARRGDRAASSCPSRRCPRGRRRRRQRKLESSRRASYQPTPRSRSWWIGRMVPPARPR